MATHEPELIRLDPESEACIDLMKAIIAEERAARIAVQDKDVDDPAWVKRVAELAADALLTKFQVRERTPVNARYCWQGDE